MSYCIVHTTIENNINRKEVRMVEQFQNVVGTVKTVLGWMFVVGLVNMIVYIYIFEF